ncbi:MAG: methyltransferase [Actinobacteria bacterium]|nr:methyltransferase [Actinomycetota bacterium]
MDRYFERTLAEHGPTARGVDWSSDEAQEVRFRQLLKICDGERGFSLIDYGCGYGALAPYMAEGGYEFTYCGFDVSERMIALARERNSDPGRQRFVASETDLAPADYAVASGVFGLRFEIDDATWTKYVLEKLETLDRLSRRGFSFNMLTRYSDPALMRRDLYYGDPCFYFDLCKQRFSRNVALLHDYEVYEFTILVRK